MCSESTSLKKLSFRHGCSKRQLSMPLVFYLSQLKWQVSKNQFLSAIYKFHPCSSFTSNLCHILGYILCNEIYSAKLIGPARIPECFNCLLQMCSKKKQSGLSCTKIKLTAFKKYLIHFKNLCKYYNIPLPSTTTK
jgi:hypothetical protein